MTFLQALRYFLFEASLNLARSWKISLLAVVTIAVSLFVGGLFLLLTTNLSALAAQWRGEARVLVYLKVDATAADLDAVRALVREPPWTLGVEEISAEQAKQRFQEIFSSLRELVEGWTEDPLPASLEVVYRPDADREAFETWLEALDSSPATAMVDDDRDWLARLETVIALIRAVGLSLGAVLLLASIFTIASVIRLTAYLYRDEISIMRLVGATEFFIRGPFYMEGLIQGLLGGLLAAGGLYGAYSLLLGDDRSAWNSLMVVRFLSSSQVALVILVGGIAGLAGTLFSLHRESLRVAVD